MVDERRRIIQRLRALFLESALRARTRNTPPRRLPTRSLPQGATRNIARAYLYQLDVANELVASARALLLEAAALDPAFKLLQTIPYIGRIRSATLLGIVGHPARFSARRKFWAYGGLGVIQKVSSEHRIENGEVVREARPRGVRRSNNGQPLLKKVLCDVALHASAGRGEFRTIFEKHLARGKRTSIARLALARKIASLIIAIWRSSKPYDPSLLKPRRKTSGRASNAPSATGARALKATALSICRPEDSLQRKRRTG
jgi:transposase